VKRSPLKSRYRDTGPDPETVSGVVDRDAGHCVRCGDPVFGARGEGWSIQHRKKRSAGVDNSASNLVLVCGNGVTGCHGWIEDHPTQAAHEGGWSVSRYAEPAQVPVLIRSGFGERWVYLGADGYRDDPPEVA
jgi:hypothetical protein